MAKWYVQKGGVELGPFENAQVKHLASSGKLKPEDVVRRDDQQVGRKASDIKGLWTNGATKESEHKNETKQTIDPLPSEQKSGQKEVSFLQRVKESSSNVADFAKKQARLKSLDFVEIPAQDFKIGTKAFELRIGTSDFQDIYSKIEETDTQVTALRSSKNDLQNDTITDRMKKAGSAAINLAKVESLLSKRKKLIASLGESLRSVPDSARHDELRSEIMKAVGLVDARDQLKVQLTAIGEKKTLLGNTKKLALVSVVGVSVLFAAMLLRSFVNANRREVIAHRIENSAAQVLAGLEIEREIANKRALEIKKQLAEAQLTNEKRDELMQAETALKLEQANLENELRQQQLIAENERKDRQRKAEEDKEKAQLDLETEANFRKEQVNRQNYAETLFSSFSFDPTKAISLSESLVKAGTKVELRGPNYELLKRLHESKNWLGLINSLSGTRHNSFPETKDIDAALRFGFFDGNGSPKYSILFVTKMSFADEELGSKATRLCCIGTNATYTFGSGSDRRHGWYNLCYLNPHPDGIGYLYDWNPSYGALLFFTISSAKELEELTKDYEAIISKIKSRKTKVELGEISEATLASDIAAESERFQRKVVEWARKH